VIEESAKGNPYEVYVEPGNRMPVVHIKDAARAFVDLAAAPKNLIKTVNYIVIGPSPTPSPQELVELVRKRIPKAQISFKTDERIQEIMNVALRLPLDDSYARKEWGWTHRYNLEATVDDFLSNVKRQGAAAN
jgi:threonine 3-dehydrogenase